MDKMQKSSLTTINVDNDDKGDGDYNDYENGGGEEFEYKLSSEEISHCSFQNWYPLFRKKTLKSKVIPLSKEFIEYLLNKDSEGLFLPKSISINQNAKTANQKKWGTIDWDDDDDDENNNAKYSQEFPDIQNAIQDAIDEYEGEVFPKLNWSAPRDATWMIATNTLKCQTVEDVFLVLKSSDFIIHDLEKAYVNSTNHSLEKEVPRVLVIRKWYDILESMEFRCFVRNKKLVAISQRDCANYYSFLVNTYNDLHKKLYNFWQDIIEQTFPLSNYTVDLYVSRKGSVWIIDFNVYGPPVQSLLFEWEEIETLTPLNSFPPSTMRIVGSQQQIRPSLSMYSRLPRELCDVSNSGLIEEFIKSAKMQEDEKNEQIDD